MVFATMANAADTPNYQQAMNGPDADGYWVAMEDEYNTLTDKDSWEIVDRTPDMKVLGVTWAYCCKRFQVLSASSKPDFVYMGTSKSKAFISLTHVLLWYNGQLFI
jgi:hypothetical protein